VEETEYGYGVVTKLIGIAGKPGSGKSAIGRALASRPRIEWIDLDRVAWETYEPWTETYRRVVERFGDGVVGEDGAIARGELAVRVFLDPAAKEDLEAIVHPAVVERIEALRSEHDRRGTAFLIAEGALLTTSRHVNASVFDALIWLEASDAVREARLAAEGRADHAARGDGLAPSRGAIVVDAEGPVEEVVERVLRVFSTL
jgi:dephospho-CoA kinase